MIKINNEQVKLLELKAKKRAIEVNAIILLESAIDNLYTIAGAEKAKAVMEEKFNQLVIDDPDKEGTML